MKKERNEIVEVENDISVEEWDNLNSISGNKGKSKEILEFIGDNIKSVKNIEDKFGNCKNILNYLKSKKKIEIKKNGDGVKFVKKVKV